MALRGDLQGAQGLEVIRGGGSGAVHPEYSTSLPDYSFTPHEIFSDIHDSGFVFPPTTLPRSIHTLSLLSWGLCGSSKAEGLGYHSGWEKPTGVERGVGGGADGTMGLCFILVFPIASILTCTSSTSSCSIAFSMFFLISNPEQTHISPKELVIICL